MARSARLYAIMVFPTPPFKEANPIDFNIVLPPVVITEFQTVVMVPKPMAVITGVLQTLLDQKLVLLAGLPGGWLVDGTNSSLRAGDNLWCFLRISHYVDRK